MFERRRVRLHSVPSKCEGGEAPKGAGAERRTPWPVSRSGRSLQRKGSPASNVGRRASRRSTAAFLSVVGPRFRPDTAPDRQPAPGRRLVVASRAEPRRRPSAWLRATSAGAASCSAFGMSSGQTPLGEQDERGYGPIPRRRQDYFHRIFIEAGPRRRGEQKVCRSTEMAVLPREPAADLWRWALGGPLFFLLQHNCQSRIRAATLARISLAFDPRYVR